MSVVQFTPKEKIERHATGKAKCLACKHEWAAVVPIPVDQDFECPQCHLPRGVYIFPFCAPDGSALWTCNCGNQLMKLVVRPDGSEYALCIGCGNAKAIVT